MIAGTASARRSARTLPIWHDTVGMGRLRLVLACALLSTSSGCSVALLGASLEPPRAAPVSVSRVAWLAPVQVTDAQIADRNDLERTLAPVIATYTQDAKYFPRVNLLPGHPADGDVVLRFEFDQYQLQRQPHPAAVPFYLFGLYPPYWAFGGPVDRDVAMLSGGLRIEDSAGNALADSRGHFEDRPLPVRECSKGFDQWASKIRAVLATHFTMSLAPD